LVSTPAGKIRSLTRRKEREVIALDAIVEGKFQNGHAGANNLQTRGEIGEQRIFARAAAAVAVVANASLLRRATT
jgi:hypothetical protein